MLLTVGGNLLGSGHFRKMNTDAFYFAVIARTENKNKPKQTSQNRGIIPLPEIPGAILRIVHCCNIYLQ